MVAGWPSGLRSLGRRHLHDDALFDADDNLRVIIPTPSWDDFVQLTCREIRHYGASNFKVARRLRAMIENLIASLSGVRHPTAPLRTGYARPCGRIYVFPEDFALARQPDLQGIEDSSAPHRYLIEFSYCS